MSKQYRMPKGKYWSHDRQRWEKISTAQKALKIAKKNRAVIKSESDVYIEPFTRTATAMNATPVVRELPVYGMAGYNIKMKNFYIKGIIRHNDTSVLCDSFRVDLVLDHNPSGAVPTPADVYGSATPVVTTQKKVGSQQRYKILRTWFGTVNKYSNSSYVFNDRVRLGYNVQTKLSANGQIANLTKNSLSLIYWTTATANQPTIQYDAITTNPQES